MEEQSRQATDAARMEGREKKQVAPPDLLEEAFELNMQLEEMRFAKAAETRDDAVERDLQSALSRYTGMLQDLGTQLEGLWSDWDAAEDAGDEVRRAAAKEATVALLNRRSYIRNLVRDVTAALE